MKKLLLILSILLVWPLQQHRASAQQTRWAVVKTSVCHLRARPDYESGMESQSLMGTVVQITAADRYWRKVNVPDYRDVWTNDLALSPMSEARLKEYLAAPKLVCTATHSNVFSRPDPASLPVCDLVLGDVLRYGEADACLDPAWTAVLTPDGQQGYVPSSHLNDFNRWASSVKASEASLVATAKRFLGTPYLWGGAGPSGFDCSGLVKTVYLANGITLPRNAREQIRCGEPVEYSLEAMRPGDLLFYGTRNSDGSIRSVTHVAMYIGDGLIIHSSQLVRINTIDIAAGRECKAECGKPAPDLYDRTPIAVRRMLGTEPAGGMAYDPAPSYFRLAEEL